MGLLAPLALAALPLLGIIIALYLLRLRRPMAPIASLHLWGSITRDREANSLWQRLRVSMLLLLQLLALLALILALARPWVSSAEAVGQNVIIVLDVSASMGATDADGGGSRLQAAQSKALSIVDNLPQDGTATLITTDDHASVLVPTTDDKARLRSAIAGTTAHASSTDMVEAMKLAGAIAARQANSRVWVLSDGAFPPVAQQVEPVPGQINFVSFGQRSDNQGITALSLQPKGGSLSLFVQIASSSDITTSRKVELTVDDSPWTARTLEISPGATQETVIDDAPLAARVIQAQLDGPDSLDMDDHAWVVNRTSAPANVLLVTGGDKFLELALSLLPTVTLYKVPPADYNPTATVNGEPVDLTIFDADVPTRTLQTLPTGNILMLAPKTSNQVISVQGVIDNPSPSVTSGGDESDPSAAIAPATTQAGRDPLLRFVDLRSLHMAKAAHIEVPKWGREVLSSDKGPLIVAGEEEGRKLAVIAFDLHDSDLAVQTAFPLLMRNLVTYLLPDPTGGLPASIAPRSPLGISAASAQVNRIVVEDPASKEWTYPLDASKRRIAFGETSQPGVYYVTQYAGDKIEAQEAVAANLFSRDETMITPNASPALPPGIAPLIPSQSPQSQGVFRRELWPLAALAGFLVLLVEWLYAQRIAIRRALTEIRTRRALDKAERV